MNIGFIGLGRMGSGMAGNLLEAGHAVTVYNRTAARGRALVAQGAQVASTVAEASRGEALITMLANDAAVEEVVLGPEGVVSHLPAGALHISSSTISVALSRRLAAAHRSHGQRFVSAPVFGRPDAAAAARLYILLAGEPGAREAALPLLNVLGQRTFVVSEKPEAANLAKLTGNFLSASVIESLGEALALLSQGGLDTAAYLEFLTATMFGAPVYRTYGPLIAQRRFEPAEFAAELGAKDIRLLLGAAQDLRVPMPLASLLHERFRRLLATGGGGLDWSAIAGLAARDADGEVAAAPNSLVYGL
jgi:3-hydroxyisobutyrate dehydrogenase-like beta-hydroxyacid dehydrogenase